jgi:hypothetical protein
MRTDRGLRAQLAGRAHAAWRERWTEDPHLDGYFAAIEEARSLSR